MKTTISFGTCYDIDRALTNIAQRIGLNMTSQVLNVACEHHRVPIALGPLVKSTLVRGVDIDPDIVTQDPLIEYGNVDQEPLPYQDHSFDLVISMWGAEHFTSDRVCAESARVLQPGGSLIIVTPNRLHPVFMVKQLLGHRFARWYYHRVLKATYEPHPTYYRLNTIARLQQAARQAGFSACTIRAVGPAHLTYYVGRSRIRARVVQMLEWCTSNRLTGRYKPYLIAVCTK